MIKGLIKTCIATVLLSFSLSTIAETDISQLPIDAAVSAKPNVIFGLDDSGSMDNEVLLETNDGALWWDSNVPSFIDATGKPHFNDSGSNNNRWRKYVYLFPNPSQNDGRRLNTNNHFAIPPLPEYAYVRSHQYNPIYYNPNVVYRPWQPGYFNNDTHTFGNVEPTKAPSHPAINMNSPLTLDLTQSTILAANPADLDTLVPYTFRMLPGMTIPGNVPGLLAQRAWDGFWISLTNDRLIPDGQEYNVYIPYYPATYYVIDNNCVSGPPDCVKAPDGNTLRRYEIKPGNTFPSGRTYADEMQNFANWYTYYRKRKLMLAAAMGDVLNNLSDIRGGITLFNRRNTVTMYDFNNTDDDENARRIIGVIYTNPSSGGTPTRDLLNHIGNQFRTNNSIIQYGCQINANMILTDGFSTLSGPTPPNYSAGEFGAAPPYQTIFSQSLADIALSYYTVNLRPDLPEGLVPIESSNEPNADKNKNLHMNTYALTLGAKGFIYGTASAQTENPFANPPTWPDPNLQRNPSTIDDLWHATINGRGSMFVATDPIETVENLQNLFSNLLIKAGSGAAVGVANTNLTQQNDTVYAASYSGRYGELVPLKVDLTDGSLSPDPNGWSAQGLLDNRDSSNRIIATYNGTSGVPFQWTNLPVTTQSQLNSFLIPPGPIDGEKVLNFMRGDTSLEGTIYRDRSHLLGDLVHAEPIIVQDAMANYTEAGYDAFKTSIANRPSVIYQGSNDGMLHAFDTSTGEELWAYIPNILLSNLNKFSSKTYNHNFFVDGTPWVGDVKISSNWQTMLVGPLGAGGKGYYALNITDPTVNSESELAAKVMWEFPNDATNATTRNNIGLTFGRPLIAKTKAAGWVILVTSGYNNTTGDGKGHLFVLDPATGNVLKDLVTAAGTGASPSGLAHISAYAPNRSFDATVDFVYGGDLEGNVWRFDLSGANVADWNVTKLATLVDSGGSPQPITSAPELTEIDGNRIVYVGTGQLLGETDLANVNQQSMYALVDNKSATPEITPLRSSLAQRTVNGDSIVGNEVDYATKSGWYLDFPLSGERVNTDPVLAFGALLFTTNVPSAEACASTSYIYLIDQRDGIQLEDYLFKGKQPWSIKKVGNALTTKPVVVTLPGKKAGAIVHNTDNTSSIIDLPIATQDRIDLKAWKRVSNGSTQ